MDSVLTDEAMASRQPGSRRLCVAVNVQMGGDKAGVLGTSRAGAEQQHRPSLPEGQEVLWLYAFLQNDGDKDGSRTQLQIFEVKWRPKRWVLLLQTRWR